MAIPEQRQGKRALAATPPSPTAAIRRRSLDETLFRLNWAVKGLDRRRRRVHREYDEIDVKEV
jgi:hypothetical protein